jgi:hypothetical protein
MPFDSGEYDGVVHISSPSESPKRIVSCAV